MQIFADIVNIGFFIWGWIMYRIHDDFVGRRYPESADLIAVCDAPVLKTGAIGGAVVIEAIEIVECDGIFVLRIFSREGIVGLSASDGRIAQLWPILENFIAPYFIGRDARDLESILDEVYVRENNYKLAGLAYFICIALIETAVLDMLGKAANLPVAALLGDVVRQEIDIYIASGNRDTSPEEEVAILAERVAQTGARAIKFKLGGRMSRNADSIAGRTEALLYQARRHFGDDFIIHTDGNGSYDAPRAIEIGRICEDIGAYFYEEPCPFDDLWETRAVADALAIPIAFGEQETSLRRFRWLIEESAADVLQPDVQYFGGLIRATKVARMAELANISITPHISGGITATWMLHLAAYTPNLGVYQEYKHFDNCETYFDPQPIPKNGKIPLPKGAGLGMNIDKTLLSRARPVFKL